ncbi:hypothetical protein JTE90_027353 [Oedothorax gibbosus]|uniref:DIX domain-containing protein n=1 Tax=Oedothorax gibbosus TaxID=931172 RepID=A0AAV6VZ53_9ARAC|nr:hypothetical protein JTE90_027353 [Oedothorax gibbosus]
MKKDLFVTILIEKLNKLKRDQEIRERLEKPLQELKYYNSKGVNAATKVHHPLPATDRTVAEHQKPQLRQQARPIKLNKKHAENAPQSKIKVPTELAENKSNFTTVGYCFSGNPIPYSSKVRGKRITLGYFKTLVNRKGDFRYFFKKYCNEFGTNVVFEEITDDEDILPLWDEKIFALIEEIEEYRL